MAVVLPVTEDRYKFGPGTTTDAIKDACLIVANARVPQPHVRTDQR